MAEITLVMVSRSNGGGNSNVDKMVNFEFSHSSIPLLEIRRPKSVFTYSVDNMGRGFTWGGVSRGEGIYVGMGFRYGWSV